MLQEDLNRLCQWSSDWKLQLNPAKCKALTVTLKRKPVQTTYFVHDSPLENVTEMRDLGVLIDSKLTFAEHINVTVRKANRALGLFFRSLQTGQRAGGLKTGPILAAYFGNVRSVLEYGSIIWGGAAKTNLERLERIQHKFLLWLAFHIHSANPPLSLAYSDLLSHFKVSSLASRRQQFDILFVYKIILGRIDSAQLLGSIPLHVPARLTRGGNAQLLHVPFARVDSVKRGLFVRAVQHFNSFIHIIAQRSRPFYLFFWCF